MMSGTKKSSAVRATAAAAYSTSGREPGSPSLSPINQDYLLGTLLGIATTPGWLGADFAQGMAERPISRQITVTWTELLAQAAHSAERAQLVMESALAASSGANNSALEAELTAVLPTTSELCAVLDAFGVRVPGEVAARVSWYPTPERGRARRLPPVPQDLHAKSAF
jgi:hypothetical protein